MLHALRTLGEILGGPVQYDVLDASHIVVVDISVQTGTISDVHIEHFHSHNADKYLYTRHDANRTPHVPTIRISPRDISQEGGQLRLAKTLRDKMYRSIKYLSKEMQISLNPEGILEAIEGKINQYLSPQITGLAATLTFDGKFMGEIPVIQSYFERRRRKRASKSQKQGTCAVCGEEKAVSGDISPFKFYTIDKPGYVVGGFDKARAYKAFPLCYDCRDLIQRGRQHVEANLTFAFATRIRYLLIPDFIFGTEAVRQEVLDILTDERQQRKQHLHTLTRRELRRITTDEEDILDLLGEERDVMTFHFLFMTRQQGREAIDLYIQDVYPSRLRALFAAKERVDAFLRLSREDGTWQDYDFTYATLYRFFSKADPSKRGPDLLRHFYDLVDRTFRAAPVPTGYLVPFLMAQIRYDVVTPDRRDAGWYRTTIRDALATLLFVQLTTQKEVPMSDQQPETLDAFLDALPALDSNLKKGLFLLGALTRRLLRVQEQERGSAPFWKALKSLKMNATDLQGLLPKVRNKLEEYDRFRGGEAALFEKAADYLAQVPTAAWKRHNVDELNFYFALGMGLFPKVAAYIYPQDHPNHEEEEA